MKREEFTEEGGWYPAASRPVHIRPPMEPA
jgi:hypothetical protein